MDFQIPPSFYTSDALASIALLLALILARLIAGRALQRRDSLTEQVARRWTANVRNLLVLIAVVGLIMIWAPQLRTFALSLTAVAVAIVVATKELLLCLSGAALRTFTRAFTVGDIIEIGSSRGEVLDLNLLAARLQEFEDRAGSITPTGRTIVLPYSLLFSSPAKVLPPFGRNASHSFEMTFEPDVDVFAIGARLREEAVKALTQSSSRRGTSTTTDGQGIQCHVDFSTSEIGKYRLKITIIGCTEDPQDAENAVACAVGSFVHSRREIETRAQQPKNGSSHQ